MMMTTAKINTDILVWARERSGIAVSEFAKKCGASEEKLMLQRQEWYKEYLKMQFAAPNPVVERSSAKDGVAAIVQNMRAELGVGFYAPETDEEYESSSPL